MRAKPTYEELELQLLEIKQRFADYHQTESDTRQIEDKFKNVFESANVGKSITLPDGTINVNQAFADMLGYTRAELSDLKWQKLTPDDDVEQIEKSLEPVVNGDLDSIRFDKRYIHKDGSFIWTDLSISARRDVDGKMLHFITTVVDITERKQAEDALALSESKYRLLAENSLDTVWTTDLEFNLTYVNDAIFKFLGYSAQEFIGLNPSLFTVPESMLTIQQAAESLISKLKSEEIGQETFVVKQIKKDGSIIDVEITANLLFDSEGNVTGFRGRSIDITERKHAETALNQSEANLSSLINNRSESIWSIDLNYNYLIFNNFFKNEYYNTFNIELTKGLNALEILDPELKKFWKSNYDRSLRGEHLVVEFSNPIEGRHLYYEVSLNPIMTDNQISGVSAISVDITDRKQAAEALLKQSADMLAIMENTQDSIWTINTAYEIVYMNTVWKDAFFASFGVHLEPGTVVLDVLPEPLKPLWKARYDRTLANERFEIVEEIDLGTRSIYVEISFNPIVVNNAVVGASVFGRDITKRKQAEILHKEQETLFSAFLENSPVYIFFKDSEIRTLRLSRNYEQLLGMSVENAIGKTMNDLFPSELAKSMVKDDKKILNDGKLISIVEELNGRYYETTKFPIILDNQRRMLAGFTVDITERKQAEADFIKAKDEIENSEERFNLAMKASNDGLFDWNLEANSIYYSPRWKKMLGYEDHELENDFLVWEKTTDPKDVKKSWKLQQKLISRDIDRFVLEFKMKHKDGHWVDILSRAEAIFDGAGKAIRIVGTHTDITERKHSEEALRKSEERYRGLFQNLEAGIVVHAPDTSIIINNPRASDLLGLSYQQMKGKEAKDPDWEFVSEENTSLPLEDYPVNRVIRERHAILNQILGICRPKMKDIVWVTVNGFPMFDKRGGISEIVISFVDITKRLQAEQDKLNYEKQILQTQKLESLGVLAGGIAHDFNNILMGILGYADLALSSLDPIAPAREYVQGINDSSRKAAALIKQMLAYSGKGKFSLESIDLNHLIKDTVQMLTISISKKVLLKTNYSSEPLFLDGDPSQIRQILMNLVINASDAISNKSGVIALSTGTMYCDRECIDSSGFETQGNRKEDISEGMYLFLEVSDSGAGMSKDTIARIFEPFFTTKFTGRGLGLSAVLGIVGGHHGMVTIHSEEGIGTTFKVLFPMSQGPEGSNFLTEVELNNDDEWQGQGTFLIADDEEAIRTVGKHMIQKLGYEVLTASDGLEAIKIFKANANQIVCILMDLTMPHKDGVEVFREVRKLNPKIKVILSSGYDELDAGQQFVGKGLAGFIQKPYVSRDLVKKIKEVMGPAESH
ncbi:MAG: PAS domain S-box protein [Candidatus Marinimicrobia bacterium]|nr:PAS domain S-box protein [Candidatus Neomarinimicrobiota bacterium]